MANIAGGAGKFVLKHGPLLIAKHGPTLMRAVADMRSFMKDHPGVPNWVQDRYTDITRQTDALRKKRGDAAQIRGMVDIVREQAQSADVSGDVAEWVKRADTITLRVGLAERLPPSLRETTIAGLKAESESLLAEFIDALAYVPPPHPSP